MVEDFQPLPPLAPEVNWDLKTKRITQSIFITLSLNEMWLELTELEPTNSFLADLKVARSLQYKRLKYEYFNMMVKKYGFLFWQEPSVDIGSFLELEVDLVYEKEVTLKEAMRTLKTMWKNHMWGFLKDYKVHSERRLSRETVKGMLENLEEDGDDFRFFRRFKGMNGERPKTSDFEKVFGKMTAPVSMVLVKTTNQFWDYNGGQFVFNYSGKNGNNLTESQLATTILNGKQER